MANCIVLVQIFLYESLFSIAHSGNMCGIFSTTFLRILCVLCLIANMARKGSKTSKRVEQEPTSTSHGHYEDTSTSHVASQQDLIVDEPMQVANENKS